MSLTVDHVKTIENWIDDIQRHENVYDVLLTTYNQSVKQFENGQINIYELISAVQEFEQYSNKLLQYYKSMETPTGFPKDMMVVIKDVKFFLVQSYISKGWEIKSLFIFIDTGNEKYLDDVDSFNKHSETFRISYYSKLIQLNIYKEEILELISSKDTIRTM